MATVDQIIIIVMITVQTSINENDVQNLFILYLLINSLIDFVVDRFVGRLFQSLIVDGKKECL